MNDTDNASDIPDGLHIKDISDDSNLLISTVEIMKSVLNLKNSKAFSGDNILNENIKNTENILVPVYASVFNKDFDSETLPTSWLVGYIKPSFKNKDNFSHPESCRPITNLSCLRKQFTPVLNNRLGDF